MSSWSPNSDAWEKLFSIVLVLDQNLNLQRVSDTVTRYMSGVQVSSSIFDHFQIHRPSNVSSIADIKANSKSVFLLIALDKSFALRGQMLQEDDGSVVFLGAPWLAWISQNIPDLKLSFDDFSIQDVQLDQEFFIAANQTMVTELETMNADLKSARDTAELANRAKTDFLSLMSHEMRTPLNGIVGALTLLEDCGISKQQLSLVKTARNSSDELLSAINYVLSYANLELGNTQINPSEFDIHELVKSLTDILHSHADNKKIDLHCEIDDSLPQWMLGDGDKINQIITNLTTNAIKYTDEGNVTVKAAATRQENDDVMVRIEVVDTGIGISESQLASVFDPMWSTKNRAPSEEVGIGMGIDICKQLAEMLGGDIGCESVLDEGALFWVTIPLQQVEPSSVREAKELPADVDLATIQFCGRVLLVEDSQVNQMLGKLILESLGLDVHTVSNGQEAVDQVSLIDFDLVFMDISMPVMGGIEATGLIRQMKERESTPIVALTAHALSGDKEKFIASGMNDYLPKPTPKNDMVCVLLDYVTRVVESDAGNDDSDEELKSKICDKAVLDALCVEIGNTNLSKVVGMYKDEVAMRMPKLIKYSEIEDWTNVAKEAHALSSSSRSFGVMRFGELLKDMEKSIKTQGATVSDSTIDYLNDLHEQSMKQLDAVTSSFSQDN